MTIILPILKSKMPPSAHRPLDDSWLDDSSLDDPDLDANITDSYDSEPDLPNDMPLPPEDVYATEDKLFASIQA